MENMIRRMTDMDGKITVKEEIFRITLYHRALLSDMSVENLEDPYNLDLRIPLTAGSSVVPDLVKHELVKNMCERFKKEIPEKMEKRNSISSGDKEDGDDTK